MTALTPEARAKLVDQAQYLSTTLAVQIAADGETIDRLTAERDAAEFRETMAANKAVEYLERAEAAEARVKVLAEALGELVAIVRGECPSLLNEDSGGNGELSHCIDTALKGAKP